MTTASRIALFLSVIVAGVIATPRAGAAPPAQDIPAIRYGETVSGTLDESTACQIYRFDGSAGDPVTIDMTRTGGDLDGVLVVYLRDGNNVNDAPLAENDDRAGGGLDPLVAFQLPADDWYTIAACRLQADQMRVTTGTFTLTLNGPLSFGGPSPTPAGALSNSLFGAPGGTMTVTPEPATTAAAPVATTEPLLSDVLADDTVPTLAGGDVVSGTLDPATDSLIYDLRVQAGDRVTLTWTRVTGDLSPRLLVTYAAGSVIAEAAAADPVSELILTFIAPHDEVAALAVTRYGYAADNSAGTFTLGAEIHSNTGNNVAPEASAPDTATEPEAPAAPPDSGDSYLANPCQSGDQAIGGSGSTAVLADVYLAAGDSYTPEELTRTDTFTTTDDLNAVFVVQNSAGSLAVAGIFCAPDGAVFDAGSGQVEAGGQYMLGLDWEFYNEVWQTGDWYVELYEDDALALALRFTVAP